MSIAIIKIDKSKVAALKQIAKALEAEITIMKNDEFEEAIMSKLIDEGLKSDPVSEDIIKKDFKKHGISF